MSKSLWIPSSLIFDRSVSHRAVVVYGAAWHLDQGNGVNENQIAEVLRRSQRRVRRAIIDLEASGWATVNRGKRGQGWVVSIAPQKGGSHV